MPTNQKYFLFVCFLFCFVFIFVLLASPLEWRGKALELPELQEGCEVERAKIPWDCILSSGRKEKSSNISPDMGLKYSKHLSFMG